MFDKILIANRGEIACRVIDTARRLGVATVAVYSDADRDARHVQMADQAVRLGPAPAAESYLNAAALIKAALATGAAAIHPGYGFLSENPDFVDAVKQAGLVFIGPSAGAIRAMGLKDAAKSLMEKAGVPVVPGYHGPDQSADMLAKEATHIGFPVLIKAVAGGGGRGMRRVENASEFADALASAQHEAKAAFGNDAVLIEKFIGKPRHIEVQVFGDGTDAVHLFERDCSLQRRHQKVLEEAPAPGMTPALRAEMGEAAVKAATAIGYSGAGTVEFIVDASDGLKQGHFWFMEMNTRLQVEHPVTEAITGIDLVEWQLRVASGESLPCKQRDLTLTGHAFEARLYAEDVPAGFLPATGNIEHLRFPKTARIDTGVRPGDSISPFYDPMIAKLTVHGRDRKVALENLQTALAGTQVAGIVTNIDFLSALAHHPEFSAGTMDTGLIARDLAALTTPASITPQAVALAGLVAAGLERTADFAGFSLWSPLTQSLSLSAWDQVFDLRYQRQPPHGWSFEVDGEEVSLQETPQGWHVDGAPAPDWFQEANGTISVFGQATATFSLADPLAQTSGQDAHGNDILAPMPGLVREIRVKPGDQVAKGDVLVLLEAMKMEHSLTAPRDGVIGEVLTTAASQVEAGACLITFEPLAQDEDK